MAQIAWYLIETKQWYLIVDTILIVVTNSPFEILDDVLALWYLLQVPLMYLLMNEILQTMIDYSL